MGAMVSRISSLTIVYSGVYSGAGQRRHQSSASLAFVWGIHRSPVNSPHKWPVARKMFPFDDVIIWGREVLPKAYKFHHFPVSVLTKSFALSLSRKTTCINHIIRQALKTRCGAHTYIVHDPSLWRHGPLSRYRKIVVTAIRRECRELFPRHPLQKKPLGDPGMHHGTCVKHSRRMQNPQFYVYGKRLIWRNGTRPPLVRLMVYCLAAPSLYQSQHRLICHWTLEAYT